MFLHLPNNTQNIIFTIAGIFPLISVLIVWIIYYGLKHFKYNYIPTISQTAIKFPENRIFPITMNVECVFLGFAYYIRYSATKSASQQKQKSWSITSRLFLMKLCIPVMIIGLSVLSSVTLKDHTSIHLLAASLFFYFNILFFFLCDLTAKQVGFKVSTISKTLTFCVAIFIFGHQILLSLFRKNDGMRSLSSLSQYITCLCLFIKIFMFQYEIPHVVITNDEVREVKNSKKRN